MNFTERKISVKRAIVVLARNGINVDDSEAGIILDFLYLISKNYSESQDGRICNIPKDTSNKSKSASKTFNDVF